MDVNASQSPDEPIAPGVDGTPAQPVEGQAPEPAAPPAAEGGADKATAESTRIAQAEYTRAQQAFAEQKTMLGLDKRATREEVNAAIRAALEAKAPADAGDEPVDPRVAASELRAWNAEMRMQAALHGEELTTGVIELVNLSRSGTNDPEELVTAFAGWLNDEVERRVALSKGTEPAVAPADGATAPVAPVGDIGLSEGDTAPPARPIPPTGGRPEPGTVQAIRGLFQRAAEGR